MGNRKRIWWWKWVTIGAAALLVAGVLGGWLLFQHIPGWYRPIDIPPDRQSSVFADYINTIGAVQEQLNKSDDPCEFRLKQDQVNAWLAMPEEYWLTQFRWRLPPQLSDPQIAMDQDGVRLGVTFRQGSLQVVLVGHIELSARPDGVLVRLADVSAGSLPVPRSKVRQVLASIDGRYWPAGRTMHGQFDERRMPRLTQLYEGIVLPDAWFWPDRLRPFRVTGVTVQAGEIRFHLDPLPRQAGRRSKSADGSSIPIWDISPGPAPAGRR